MTDAIKYKCGSSPQEGDTVKSDSSYTCLLSTDTPYKVLSVNDDASKIYIDTLNFSDGLAYPTRWFTLISRKDQKDRIMKFKITNGPIRPKTYFRDLKIGEWFQGTGKNSQFKAVKITKESYSNSICYYEDGRGAEGYFSPDEEVIRILDVELSGRLEA